MLKAAIITIHPRIVEAYSTFGVLRAALDKGLAAIEAVDLRRFAVDRHGSVDDAPYGGGDGMVLRPEPLAAAVRSLATNDVAPLVVLTSPAGVLWTQAEAERLVDAALVSNRPLAFVCGRFGGVDQRFVDHYVHAEYSLGDFVVSGGELPALVMLDAMLRLIPGVLGHRESAHMDSFASGWQGQLEHPLYTRPSSFEGEGVPSVLLSGDHEKIQAWRRQEAERRTAAKRPDLLLKPLSPRKPE